MSRRSHIVANGGSSVREYTGRPKCRRCCFLALLWLPVAFLASFFVWIELDDLFREWRWVVWLPGSVELIFITLALYFRFTERPRRVVEHHV